MSELDNLFNQYTNGGKTNNIENKTTRAEFEPLILDDDTQNIDNNKRDQQTIPQYVDVDKVQEDKFVAPERRSYFVAGNANNNEINTTAQRPNEIEYEADTIDDEKKKDNYFGLSKLVTNKKDIVKNALKYVVQAPNLIQNAANTIGMFTGKSGEDVIKEGVRGFAGSTVDFGSALLRFVGQNYMYFKAYKDEQIDKITNLGNVVVGGEDLTPEIKQKYTDFYKKIDEQTREFIGKTERFMQDYGIAKTDKDGFIYDLVGGASSLMYAIGLSVITKSPAAAAEVFGAYQYQSLYEEAIENGFNPLKARTIGVVGGVAEGALELVGLHVLIETLAARKSFAKILKSAATEFIQEASQQGAEELLAKFSGMREEGLLSILQNVGYAGLIGALIGGGSATISNTRFVQKMISDSATKELINIGVKDEYAKQMVNNMLNFAVSPQVADELNSMLKDEQSPVTYKNADPRETYKEFGDTVKKALDPAQKRGVELEFLQEKKKKIQEYADALINSGKVANKDEAYRQAENAVSFYDDLVMEAYNQDNIRPAEYYKRFNVNAQSGDIETDERNIDDNNISLDDSFNPIDFDETERAKYEAEIEGYEDWLADEQKRSGIKNNFETQKNILADMGIGKIRKLDKSNDRYGEYEALSPRIKSSFFTDMPTAMTWDEAEHILQQHNGDSADIFDYFDTIDKSVPIGQEGYLQKGIFNKVLAKEKEAIKQQAIADGTFLKAPNGKDSNLPEQLWLTVRTKAFKNWFGDWLNDPQNASKVVDANGEPLVVYHGTANDFRVFDKNKSYQGLFWFSNDYNKVNAGYDGAAGKGIVMPVFLNIKNAADWDLYDKYSPEELENMKYDGLLLKDGNETVAVAFDNKQIKSINNRGSFDRNNPDIYYQRSVVPTNRADKNNYVFKITAKDLVETRSRDEINDKLDNIFGPYKEFDPFEDSTTINDIDMLADNYRADLEYAAVNRDYDETQQILNSIKNDIVEISERKNYNNIDEKQKENSLSDTSRSGVLRTEKSAEGNLYSDSAKTNLQVNNLSIEQLKNINDDIVLYLFTHNKIANDLGQNFYNSGLSKEAIKFLKDNGVKTADENGVFVKLKAFSDTEEENVYYIKDIESYIKDAKDRGLANRIDYYNKQLKKLKELQNKLDAIQEKLRVYIAKNSPKQTPQQQLQVQLQADAQQPMLEIFNQQQQEQPRGSTTIYDRQYFIDLFSTSDKSTLLHETGHVFLSEILYFARSKNASKKVLEIKKKLDEWLGEPEDNGRYSTRQQELFATSAEAFFREGKAPTAKLKTVFERFKKWLSDIYDRIKDDLPKINDDVRELFNTILSRSYDVPDSNIYAGKEAAIKEVIKNIQEGRASEVDGITIDDVYNLLNVAYTRKPSKPSKNLKQLLNDKNIYDFNELNKAGADTVLQILKDGGYVKEDATAEAAVELAKAALDGNPVYRLADQWRVAGDIDFARNLRVLEKVIEFSQIDSVMEKILSLQEEGYRNVEQGDVDKVQDEYKRLMSADVKEAKKIVEDIINRLHKKRFIDRAAQKQMINDLKFSATAEEIQESVLNVIEDLQDEIKLVKEQLRNPRKPIVRKDKTIPPSKNATEEEKNNYKKYMRKQINRLLKQVLPSKQNNNKVSKFGNIDIQRFFEELIKINKMNMQESEEALFANGVKNILSAQNNEADIETDKDGTGFDKLEKIKNMFLCYKSRLITQNSCELLKELYDNLQSINIAGRTEKQIEDFLKRDELAEDTKELIANINKYQPKTKINIKKIYLYSLANWYSAVNAVAGKEQAEKDSVELEEEAVFTKAFLKVEKIVKRSLDVLGLKHRSQFTDKVNDYLNEKYTFIKNYAENGEQYSTAVTLNKMELICAYIWSKNKNLKERIIHTYGNEQFNEMMAKLDKQDMAWGDVIQEEVASMYDEINKVYIKMYGLDMGQEENYFPSKAGFPRNNVDLLADGLAQSIHPGFIKSRVVSNLPIPRFENPITIAFNHIVAAQRFVNLQLKLAKLTKKYTKSEKLRDDLEKIYGKDNKVIDVFDTMLKYLRLPQFSQRADIINNYYNRFFNSYVITRIAAKPSIMIKQLLSFTNYAVDVDFNSWIKHFFKQFKNAKQVKKWMFDNVPYLRARYEKGAQNEALEKAIEGEGFLLLKIQSFKGALSFFTRCGDLGAIIYGGYPMIQAQLEKGVPLQTAIDNFVKSTLRSQQANFTSTLSNWQNYFKKDPFLRTLSAYTNTPFQYFRKIVDTVYQWAHGDITSKKAIKALFNYAIVQSLLYNSFTSLAILSGLLYGDWDDAKDDVWLSLLQISNFMAIPILNNIIQMIAYKALDQKYAHKGIPIVDDYELVINKIFKGLKDGGDFSFEDYLVITDKVVSSLTGIPVQTLYTELISSTKDLLDGEYGKFAVKLYGATESRANKIFD